MNLHIGTQFFSQRKLIIAKCGVYYIHLSYVFVKRVINIGITSTNIHNEI